jgi:ABC-type oligopeptide transport system ATPase subunit
VYVKYSQNIISSKPKPCTQKAESVQKHEKSMKKPTSKKHPQGYAFDNACVIAFQRRSFMDRAREIKESFGFSPKQSSFPPSSLLYA